MIFLVRLSFAFALVLLASTSMRAAEAIEIKQRWLAGKKYYQTIRTDQHSALEVAGQKMEQDTAMIIDLTITVSAPTSGQPKRVTIRYEHMAMEVELNGQKMGYDSAHPGANTDPLGLSKTIGATVGQELKAVLNENDEVTSIENYDDFIKHLGPSTGPDFDPKKMFSRDSLIQMLKQGSLQSLPGKPVAIGDTWPFRNQVDLPELGKVTVTGHYTLKSVGDHNGIRCAEIATEGSLTMDIADPATGDSPDGKLGMKVTDGTLTGPVWFDFQTGIARESQLVQEMAISIKDPADASVTLKVPMKQNITVTLTKIEDGK